MIDDRVLAEIYLPCDARLADLTNPVVLGRFGITNELSTGDPEITYPIGQQWAMRLWQAGFSGVCYPARHDVELATRSVALFGKPGLESAVMAALQPLRATAEEMAQHFGYTIVSGRPL